MTIVPQSIKQMVKHCEICLSENQHITLYVFLIPPEKRFITIHTFHKRGKEKEEEELRVINKRQMKDISHRKESWKRFRQKFSIPQRRFLHDLSLKRKLLKRRYIVSMKRQEENRNR